MLGWAARGAHASVVRIANELEMGLGAGEGTARRERAMRGMVREVVLTPAGVLGESLKCARSLDEEEESQGENKSSACSFAFLRRNRQ